MWIGDHVAPAPDWSSQALRLGVDKWRDLLAHWWSLAGARRSGHSQPQFVRSGLESVRSPISLDRGCQRSFTSRDLRHLLSPQLGKDPGDMTGGQISYDLRRLRAHQIIERIPHSRTYQFTADGVSTALFFTRLTRRVLIPALADIAGTGPPLSSPLRQADRAYNTAIADLTAQASLGIQPPPATKRRSRQAPVVTSDPS
jgi:hypothetical protein